MKGIKLQLGDYVLIKSLYGGYHTSLIKISAIHLKKVGYHNVLDRLNWVRFSLLEPIPLTIEILKKNGFITQPGHLIRIIHIIGSLVSTKKRLAHYFTASRYIVVIHFVVCIFLLKITLIVNQLISINR